MDREDEDVAGDGNAELESDEDEVDDDETVAVGGVLYNISAKRRRVTGGDVAGEVIEMGKTVTAGEYRWERVENITEDYRVEPHFETSFKANMFHSDATEVEVFRALMPLVFKALMPRVTHKQRLELNDLQEKTMSH
jgi:hypothetical protein